MTFVGTKLSLHGGIASRDSQRGMEIGGGASLVNPENDFSFRLRGVLGSFIYTTQLSLHGPGCAILPHI